MRTGRRSKRTKFLSAGSKSPRLVAGLLLAAVVGHPLAARADELPLVPTVSPEPPAAGEPSIGVSYLWDGGAIPFFWGALAAKYALATWATPRSTPLFFSAS